MHLGWLVVMALAMSLEDGGLARARGRDDQAARALAERGDEVNDARFQQVRARFSRLNFSTGSMSSGSRTGRIWCIP